MRLIERQNYLFKNHGIPHENNLNLIGMALTSRKIKHNVPISIDFEIDAYVNACGENSKKIFNNLRELWEIADAVGLRFKKVEAEVRIMRGLYRIDFLCYGD